MTDRKIFLWLAVMGTCLWPELATAEAQKQQPDAAALLEKGLKAKPELGNTSEVEVGAGYNTKESFKFGEYTGLQNNGPFAIGTVDIERRAPFNSKSSQYWGITGTNLGLDSRSFRLKYGRQGQFDLFLDYDQIPRYQIEGAQTPYSGEGTGQLTLPAALQNSGSTAGGIAGLGSSLRSIDIETERTNMGGGITWHLSPKWSIKGTYQHQVKEGTDTIAGVFGENGGNPLAAMLPAPIDYEEDSVDFALNYAGERLQAKFWYSGSWFRNNESSLRWDNPFVDPGAFNSWDVVPTEGQMDLPPDNQAHRVNLSAGYNLGDTTHLNGVFSYGWMLQNETFLPYTVTLGLADVDPTLPRQSLDGQIKNLLVDLSASTRPTQGLDLRARYRYDDRDNDTPRDIFLPVSSDTQLQSKSEKRLNLPYSSTRNLVGLDAGYLLFSKTSTKLSVGYDFEQKEQTFTEVARTREHTGRMKIQSTPFAYLSGSLKYAHTIREGSNYQGNAPLLASHVGLAADDYENHPELRKFYLADRDGDTVSGALSFLPHEQVTVGLSGHYTKYNYNDGIYGLRDHDLSDVTLDVSYSPMSNVMAYAFYTYEHQNFAQDGIQWTPAQAAGALANDPSQRWSADTRDRVNTTGARLEWNAIENLFDVSLDYSFSRAVTSFQLTGGTLPDTTPLPNLTSSQHSFGINADYHLRENMSLRFGYRFETLSTEDFALEGVDVDTINQFLTLGQSSPDYVAHVVGVSLSCRF